MKDQNSILNKRICDVEKDAENTETYKEFIASASSQVDVDYNEQELEGWSNDRINEHVDFIDFLLIRRYGKSR